MHPNQLAVLPYRFYVSQFYMCYKILIMWLSQDQTNDEMLNIPEYQMVPMLTWVFTGNFCYCSYTWSVQLIRGLFHLDISFLCWSRVIRILFCVSRVFTEKRSCWSRRKGIRTYHIAWCKTLVEAFLIMSLRSICFIDEDFLW